LFDLSRQRCRISARDEFFGAEQVGNSADCRANAWKPARHRLDHGSWQPLGFRSQNEKIRAIQFISHAVARGNTARELYDPRDAAMLGVPLERFATPAVSNDHELNIHSVFCARRHRVNQNIEAFVRNIERSDTHNAQRLEWGEKDSRQGRKSVVADYYA
jgi:hypothetical protein